MMNMVDNKKSAVITTCCVGLAAAGAAYMMSGSSKGKARKIKKSTGKALRQMSGFIDNVSYMMK